MVIDSNLMPTDSSTRIDAVFSFDSTRFDAMDGVVLDGMVDERAHRLGCVAATTELWSEHVPDLEHPSAGLDAAPDVADRSRRHRRA